MDIKSMHFINKKRIKWTYDPQISTNDEPNDGSRTNLCNNNYSNKFNDLFFNKRSIQVKRT